MPPKKKGFGEKLKGIGRRIVQEAKKVPGTVYREGIKPEAKRILEKFTEVGPAPGRPISGEPQAGTTTAPFEEGPKGLRRGRRTSHLDPKILPPKEQVSRPAPKAQTIAEQIAPKDYGRAGGRTGAYDRSFTGKSAVQRLNEIRAKETKAKPQRNITAEKPPSVKVTTAGPLVDQTKSRVPGRSKSEARGTVRGYRIKTDAAVPTSKKETRTDKTAAARKQRAGLMESRKGKGGKRKFSGRKTTKTLGEAARASQKDIEIERLDTTAQEMARLMTEQDVGREAERAEAALKQGRTPRREKARYRYRTRGLRRTENRGR